MVLHFNVVVDGDDDNDDGNDAVSSTNRLSMRAREDDDSDEDDNDDDKLMSKSGPLTTFKELGCDLDSTMLLKRTERFDSDSDAPNA